MRQYVLITLAILLASAAQCDASPPTPTAAPTLAPPTSAPMPPTATQTPSPTSAISPTATPMPTVAPEPTTAPSPTSSQPVVLAQGQFVDANNRYHGSGTATVVRHPDGRLVLQFEDFMVSDGPGLHVLLATTAAPQGAADLEGHVDLGELQSVRGDQTYDIPSDTDLARYQSAVIYCVPFKVLFAYATLIR